MSRLFTLTALFTFALAMLASGCSDPLYGRDVSGMVAKDPTSRIKSGTDSVQEKISITLSPYEADDVLTSVAGGPSGLVVECLSTKCAQLTAGMCANFKCKQVVNWTEPNVVQCKMDKEIECEDDAEGTLESYGDGAGDHFNCPDGSEDMVAAGHTCRYLGCLTPSCVPLRSADPNAKPEGNYGDGIGDPCIGAGCLSYYGFEYNGESHTWWLRPYEPATSTSNWNGFQLGERPSAGDC